MWLESQTNACAGDPRLSTNASKLARNDPCMPQEVFLTATALCVTLVAAGFRDREISCPERGGFTQGCDIGAQREAKMLGLSAFGTSIGWSRQGRFSVQRLGSFVVAATSRCSCLLSPHHGQARSEIALGCPSDIVVGTQVGRNSQ